MTRLRRARAIIAWPLMVLMMSLTLPAGYARAAIVGTEQIIERRSAAEQRAHVQSFLKRDDVKQHMTDLGVSPDEAAARVDGLSDAEVTQLASRIDTLPAGQAVGSAVVLLLVVIILILIIPFR